MIIGIGGISRAGKTSLSHILKKEFNQKTVIIHFDEYIKESSHWDFYSKFPMFYLCKLHKTFNMEHPNTFDFDRMYADVVHACKENEIVIIEGIYIIYDTRIKNILNRYIHLSLSRNIFTQRRIRDFRCNAWYANHVWKSFMKYGTNYSDLDHIVVDGDKEIDIQTVLRFVCDQ
jgi:uridine kinase